MPHRPRGLAYLDGRRLTERHGESCHHPVRHAHGRHHHPRRRDAERDGDGQADEHAEQHALVGGSDGCGDRLLHGDTASGEALQGAVSGRDADPDPVL